MESLSQLLDLRLSCHDCGLWSQGEWTSYADLIEEARYQAELLEGEASLVIVADNSREQVVALLAAWWAGVVPICLAPPGRLGAQAHSQSWLQQALEQLPQPCRWTCQAQFRRRLPQPQRWQELPWPRGSQPAALARPNPLAYLQFSSGTTHHPRAIALSQSNLCANLAAITSQLPGGPQGHSCVSWLPLHHDMGLIGCLLGALYAPGSLSLWRPSQFALNPAGWLDEISQRGATISAMPNFALEFLLNRDRGQRPLHCLQQLLIGAETISPHSLQRFAEHYASQGLDPNSLTPSYGLAEATLACSFGRGPRLGHFSLPQALGQAIVAGEQALVNLGPPLPGVSLSILDEGQGVLGEDRLGQIAVAGPGLAQGLVSPYPTGDLGFLHRGELFFVGRSKDVLIHHGRNHHPEAVEELLPGWSCAAIESQGRILCLLEGQPQIDNLGQARQRLARAPLPVEPVLVARGWLPRTSSGKISRSQARAKWEESPA